jgi:sugar phosphate isomerase/epimerase
MFNLRSSEPEARQNRRPDRANVLKSDRGGIWVRTIKGPALLIAQLANDRAPFNTLPGIAKWAAGLGYKGLQLPSSDTRFLDLHLCAESQTYAEEITGTLKEQGLAVTELVTALQGQLIAVHPAYDAICEAFAPASVQGNPRARQAWAVEEMKIAARASQRLGLKVVQTFTGSLAWPYCYPWPQRPGNLIESAFEELGRRWSPILDAFDEAGVDVGFELHPCQDVFDGETFEQFLAAVGDHPRCAINYDASHLIKQGLDYVAFIDIYHERIKGFHVKDAEFRPTGKQGFYSGYQPWLKRAARDRSLGDGQVDFNQIFSKFAEYDFDGWAVYEWEDCLKHPEVAAAEGAPFIARHIIRVTDRAFDDFAASGADRNLVNELLGFSNG